MINYLNSKIKGKQYKIKNLKLSKSIKLLNLTQLKLRHHQTNSQFHSKLQLEYNSCPYLPNKFD